MENIIGKDSEEIESVVAMLRNFSPPNPVENAVIYFWESHNKYPDEKMKTQATADLIYKEFDLLSCEKYEVRTGYLSRWNYMLKPLEICAKDEIEKAISRGKEEECEWLNRCQPDFPEFIKKDWKDCIYGEKNPYYESCKNLVIKKINSDEIFANAFTKSVDEFLSTHNTDRINCNSYIIEEASWILTLPLLHLNKPIYLVHIGSANSAVVAMFHHFPNLQKAVKWLSPRFSISKFQNASEFLLDYRNALHVGHSYAIENKEIVREIKIFNKQKTQNLQNSEKLLKNESIKNNLLSSIIDEIPCHVYWLDYNNVYQGCNYMQAKTLGLSCSVDIIGKTNYDLHSFDEATKLNEINYAVMSTGHVYESEDTISLDGQFKKFLSKKTPIFDAAGKVIGLLGVSFDITEKKKAEELENKLKIQEELYEIAKGVAHDICSPISALDMVKYMSLDKLGREEKEMFEMAIRSIRDISDRLIKRYRNTKGVGSEVVDDKTDKEEYQYIAPYSMKEIVDRKIYQCQNKTISINFYPDKDNKYVFIKGNFSNFSRLISNVLNNAVEAIEGKEGVVEVSYEVKGEEVEVRVKDNGTGMPKEMVEKINRGMAVGTTKENGHGIGMEQIIKVVGELKGKMEVKSKEGEGTEFVLRFARSEKPKWFVEKIEIKKGSKVVVLDDDVLVHEIWKKRFKEYEGEIEVKYFTKGMEAIEYINSVKEKENVLLVTEYEFKGERINGIEVIERSGMKDNHILATNKYLSEIKEFEEKSKFLKISSKMYINEIRMEIN